MIEVNENNTKICTKCKRCLSLDNFYKRGNKPGSYQSWCKECDRKKGSKYYRDNREKVDARHKKYNDEHPEELKKLNEKYRAKPGYKEKQKMYDEQKRIDNPYKAWAWSTISCHRSKMGLEVNLSTLDLVELVKNATVCPICGTELVSGIGTGRHTKQSPSLDRIDNGTVLNHDNVWIICRRCNIIKHDMSMAEFVEYCRNVVNKFG